MVVLLGFEPRIFRVRADCISRYARGQYKKINGATTGNRILISSVPRTCNSHYTIAALFSTKMLVVREGFEPPTAH